MKELLKELCLINGVSGDESAVREFIIGKVKDFCEYRVDPLGSLICFHKKRKSFCYIQNNIFMNKLSRYVMLGYTIEWHLCLMVSLAFL